ncbi:MAG: ChaN family lipoprotein, partial [Pseudomonadota bacterium]
MVTVRAWLRNSVGLLLAGLLFAVAGVGVADADDILIDMLMGEPVPMDVMLDDLAEVRVVYIGEIHTIQRHHRVQRDIIEGLSQRGVKPALGMEMFGRHHQPILDKWCSGTEDVERLVRDLGHGAWTNLKDYEDVLYLARELKAPIIGLNAPDDLVKKVAVNGPSGLSDADRNGLPADFADVGSDYARLLKLRLKVHRAFQERALDNIIAAQALRDAA